MLKYRRLMGQFLSLLAGPINSAVYSNPMPRVSELVSSAWQRVTEVGQ